MQFRVGQISFYLLNNERANKCHLKCLDTNPQLHVIFHVAGTNSNMKVPDATALGTRAQVDLHGSNVKVSERGKMQAGWKERPS